MSGSIYLIRGQGSLVPMSEQPYDSEALLQELLAEHPALMAGEQMIDGAPRRWLLVAREIPVSVEDRAVSWYVDHLFLDQDGIPTLVEVKRSSDTRIRREVVGQMLDYAANAVNRWSVEQLRARFASDPQAKERLDVFLGGSDAEIFWEWVGANLAGGRIRMVFVADEIPPELRRIVDFLSAQFRTAEIFAVGVRHYHGAGARALVPRLVSTPKSVGASGEQRQWDEQSFFRELASRSPERAEVARFLFEWAKHNMPDLWWGNGATAGSCFPRLLLPAGKVLLFAMWTYGAIEMQFQHMRVPPFDNDASRPEMVRRLNAIRGVHIPEDAIRRRPTIDMMALAGEAERSQFIEVMNWALEQIRPMGASAAGV